MGLVGEVPLESFLDRFNLPNCQWIGKYRQPSNDQKCASEDERRSPHSAPFAEFHPVHDRVKNHGKEKCQAQRQPDLSNGKAQIEEDKNANDLGGPSFDRGDIRDWHGNSLHRNGIRDCYERDRFPTADRSRAFSRVELLGTNNP